MSRYLKLIGLAGKLIRLAAAREELQELARRYGGRRSMQLEVYDEQGETLSLWFGVEDGEVVIRRGRYPATNTLRLHVDVLLDIVGGKLDFRTAVAHGLVEIESHDGLPWAFHFFLWSSFWDKVQELVR